MRPIPDVTTLLHCGFHIRAATTAVYVTRQRWEVALGPVAVFIIGVFRRHSRDDEGAIKDEKNKEESTAFHHVTTQEQQKELLLPRSYREIPRGERKEPLHDLSSKPSGNAE
uniref:Transmembrane protein n=1 Tax=Steinernema glaseri TaxID=37863 RepID=A0A1I7Y1D5_9BILA